jgi:topoisomerase-4 subunit A
MLVEKFDPERIITAVYLDNDKGQYNLKRFRIETTTLKTRFPFIKDGKGNILEAVSTEEEPILLVQQGKGTQARTSKFKVAQIVDVMGWKAIGAKLIDYNKSILMSWEVAEAAKQSQLF